MSAIRVLRSRRSIKTMFALTIGIAVGWVVSSARSPGADDGIPHPGHVCIWIQCADVMSTSSDCGGGWCWLGIGHQWYKCMPNEAYNCTEFQALFGAPITCNGTCQLGGGFCSHGPYNRCNFGGG
jgi:hypothetical protein